MVVQHQGTHQNRRVHTVRMQAKLEILQQLNQHTFQLELSESLANAIAIARTERHRCERTVLIVDVDGGIETFRPEYVRILVHSRIAAQTEYVDGQVCTGRE